MNTPRISATTFYEYVRCPLQLWFHVHEGKPVTKSNNPIRDMLAAQGRAHETAVAETLGFPLVSIAAVDPEEAWPQTLAAMKEGKHIYQGTLLDGRWVGRPDILLPKRGKSKLGGHHYAACDVKLAAEITDEHKFQLTFYTLLLEKVQGVRPRFAYFVGRDGKMQRFEVAEFLDKFELTLAAIERILAGEKPPPFLSGSCKDSPWFDRCRAEALACNDLSLLYKLWRGEYDILRRAGMKTIDDLANTDVIRLKEKVSGISLNRLIRLQQHAVALKEKTHIILARPTVPTAPLVLFYDIETDMLAERPVHYLHGILAVKQTKSGTPRVAYKSFLVRNPAREEEAWHRFCVYLATVPPGTPIVHYGHYENEVIAELSARYGISRVAEARCADMFDLSRVAQQSVIFPTLFYSLKDLAKYLGFKWRHAEASGINSIGWYQEWRRGKNPTHRKQMLRDILEYNEDDVLATKVLYDFFRSLS